MKDVLDIPRTAMEVFEMLPEGTACEVINNTLYMSPSPNADHQDILLDLATEFKMFLKKNVLGRVFVAPLDVHLNGGENVVQPDIFFIKKDREFIIEKKGIYGAPDLVIEILSSNKAYDQQIKMELYQENNIAEYIIIDPDNKSVWQYLLNKDKYVEQSSSVGKLHIHTINLHLEF